ncbi:hypothetical protein K7432_013346 [Basidiobolus ranarum]|uniref:Major facilitator superfamily (MFS) profile domain-containing protein n=1 Tax=Basidiobolus ranarum TaxID=34480 RepID=A0ABR2VQX3_9FUNG
MEQSTPSKDKTLDVYQADVEGEKKNSLGQVLKTSMKEDTSVIDEKQMVGNGAEEGVEVLETGRYALVVIFAAFMINFAAFGYVTVWGIFQDFYLKQVFQTTSTVSISFVGSMAVAAEFGFSLFSGPIMSIFGYKVVLWGGCFFVSIGLLAASWATEFWHLYVTQGLMFGIGASFLYMAASSIPPLWFTKRQGLAMGIAASGSGIGGLVLGPIVRKLLDTVGIAWALRVVAIFELVASSIAAILLRAPRRETSSGEKVVDDGKKAKMLDFSVWKCKGFVLWTCSAALFTFGYLIPFSFVPAYSTFIGLTTTDGAIFVSVMSGCNAAGRIAIGFFADRVGRVNVAAICYFLSGLACLAVWMQASSYALVMVLSITYGLFSGVFFTLAAPITAKITVCLNGS